MLTYGTLRSDELYVKSDIREFLEAYDDAWVCDPRFALSGGSQRVRSDAADEGAGRIFLECEAQPDLPRAGEAGGRRLRYAQCDRAEGAPGQEGLRDYR